MSTAPVIIEPFSLLGDTVAGHTPDEVALNLAGCLKVDLAFRCRPRRALPDLREVFRGCRLSEPAKEVCRFVAGVYARGARS